MYNLEQDTNKSSELDFDKHVMPLWRVGFNTIPLRQDSVIPNIPSTNEIYNNPESLTEENVQKSHHLFYNVATIFGKSHIKDKDGNDLFLNCMDIDSDKVFTRLAIISFKGKDVALVNELCKSTYVTKTSKKNGYHIYWFSHRQNKPIRASDCKFDCKFEIKTDNSTGHCTLPPSRHRVDSSYHYYNVGQDRIDIIDDLYDGLIDLLSDFIKEKKSSASNNSSQLNNELSHSDCLEIASAVANVYHTGSRNDIIFVLSSYLWHEKVKLVSAETVIEELCKLTLDEEIANRLEVVRRTYTKANSGEVVTGCNKLIETLENTVGLLSANSIIDKISTVLTRYDTVLSELNQSIRKELAGHIFEIICYTPPTFVVAHAVKKQIVTFKALRSKNHNDQKIESLRWGEVIVNAIPENIVRYENPLNNTIIKYQAEFISPTRESFITKPKTPIEIVSDLRMRSLVYKPRIAEEALNAILNGALRDHKMKILRQIDTPGFYFIDGKMVSSTVNLHQPSTEEIRTCAEFLNELFFRSKHPEISVSEIKWGMLAPFSFVFKQLSEEGRERRMPWLYLYGYTTTSKTTDGSIALAIYRRQKDKVGLSSANNIARLGEEISKDTFPKLINEVNFDPKLQSELIEAIKHAVQGQIARKKLSVTSEPVHISALSPCIFTSNHQLPTDPALRKRFLNYHYPKDDKPTADEIKEFESFLKNGMSSLGTLGDFTIAYLLQHQEIIIDDSNEWFDIAKIVLKEFYNVANLELPNWIDMIYFGNQIEDVEAEEEQIIRSFFSKRINDAFSRSYKSIEPWKEQEVDSAINKYGSIRERLNFCLDKQLIPFIHKKSNSQDVQITIDILKELREADITFVQHFTDLARLIGAKYKPVKIDHKTTRLIVVSPRRLIEFIESVAQ